MKEQNVFLNTLLNVSFIYNYVFSFSSFLFLSLSYQFIIKIYSQRS